MTGNNRCSLGGLKIRILNYCNNIRSVLLTIRQTTLYETLKLITMSIYVYIYIINNNEYIYIYI